MRRIVRVNARFSDQVVQPDDVGVVGQYFDGRFARLDHVLAFVLIRSVIAVGHSIQIQADDLRTIRHDVDAVSFDRGW